MYVGELLLWLGQPLFYGGLAVYVMCRFNSSDATLAAVLKTVRQVLDACGLKALVASDKLGTMSARICLEHVRADTAGMVRDPSMLRIRTPSDSPLNAG